MAAFKVSLAFLDGSVSSIIAKSSHIATCLKNNPNYKLSPVSSEGLSVAVDELKQLEKKAKSGKKADIEKRDTALADVNDYILQIAEYVNYDSRHDMEILLSSGFDFNGEFHKKSEPVKHVMQ